MPTTPFTSIKDTKFGDCYFDISQTEKRLLRATLKTYERTRTYVFLKLFKKAAEDYKFEPRISLTLEEFGSLVKKAEKIVNLQRKIPHQNHPQQRSRNLISVVKMVEAMFERSPNYFKQFQKQFKFLITDEKPNLTASNNYAVCPHFESDFCQLPTNHFHVLIESAIDVETMKPIKTLTVPCLFTTFRHLFSTSTSLEFKGDTFSRLQLAVDFNDKSGEKMDTANVRKQLPPSATAATKLQTLQRSLAEFQKHWQDLHQLYHRKQFTILCVLQFLRKLKLIKLVVKL